MHWPPSTGSGLAASTASDVAKLAAETPKSMVLAHGNYLISFAGYKPVKEEVDAVKGALVQVDDTVLPPLAGYLPVDNLVAEQRTVHHGTGQPEAIRSGDPAVHRCVPPQRRKDSSGVFHNPKGDMKVVIFNYPTSQIAMQRVTEFEKLSGAIVKRSGPLVAVTVAPPDPDFAEHVLGQVRYQAEGSPSRSMFRRSTTTLGTSYSAPFF